MRKGPSTPSAYLDAHTPPADSDNEEGREQQRIVVAEGAGDEASDWQMFYDDESTEEPIPWWFNSVTGESTWDCPAALTAVAMTSKLAGADGDKPGLQEGQQELAIVDPVLNLGWTQLWSEEYQVRDCL